MKLIATIAIPLLATVGCMSSYRGIEIRERLYQTPGLTAYDISIDEDIPGVIALNGKVAIQRDFDMIEEIASNTRGVKEVNNYLIVDPRYSFFHDTDSFSPNAQRALVSEIISNMKVSPDLGIYSLKVDGSGSTVTLRGEVASEKEREAAERVAKNTSGVTKVKNELVVRPPSNNELKQKTKDITKIPSSTQ